MLPVFYANMNLMDKDMKPDFGGLQNLVNQLIDRCETDKRKVMEAEKTIEVLERELRDKIEKTADLEKRIEALQVAGSAGSAKDADQMKRHVSELIREVDRCIALLND